MQVVMVVSVVRIVKKIGLTFRIHDTISEPSRHLPHLCIDGELIQFSMFA